MMMISCSIGSCQSLCVYRSVATAHGRRLTVGVRRTERSGNQNIQLMSLKYQHHQHDRTFSHIFP